MDHRVIHIRDWGKWGELGRDTLMTAGPLTLADLRKAGIITSQEIVAAIDAYMRDPAVGAFRFASGHTLDLAALVARALSCEEIEDRAGPQEKTYRAAVAAVIMAARPTRP